MLRQTDLFLGLSVTHFQLTVDGAFCITLSHGVTLVVLFFTFAKTDLNFHSAALEIDGYGNKRQTVLLYLSEQLHYFTLVHKQFSGSQRILVEYVALFVRRDVHLLDK